MRFDFCHLTLVARAHHLLTPTPLSTYVLARAPPPPIWLAFTSSPFFSFFYFAFAMVTQLPFLTVPQWPLAPDAQDPDPPPTPPGGPRVPPPQPNPPPSPPHTFCLSSDGMNTHTASACWACCANQARPLPPGITCIDQLPGVNRGPVSATRPLAKGRAPPPLPFGDFGFCWRVEDLEANRGWDAGSGQG